MSASFKQINENNKITKTKIANFFPPKLNHYDDVAIIQKSE